MTRKDVQAVASGLMRELARRQDMLIAAFMAETGLPLARCTLVVHHRNGAARQAWESFRAHDGEPFSRHMDCPGDPIDPTSGGRDLTKGGP